MKILCIKFQQNRTISENLTFWGGFFGGFFFLTFDISSYISWDALVRKFKDGELSFLCVNAMSFLRKFPELLFHLSALKNKFTYIIITESWLTHDNDYALEIPGYLSKSLYRTGTTRGGIKIYYLEGIVAKVLEEFTVCNNLYMNPSCWRQMYRV